MRPFPAVRQFVLFEALFVVGLEVATLTLQDNQKRQLRPRSGQTGPIATDALVLVVDPLVAQKKRPPRGLVCTSGLIAREARVCVILDSMDIELTLLVEAFVTSGPLTLVRLHVQVVDVAVLAQVSLQSELAAAPAPVTHVLALVAALDGVGQSLSARQPLPVQLESALWGSDGQTGLTDSVRLPGSEQLFVVVVDQEIDFFALFGSVFVDTETAVDDCQTLVDNSSQRLVLLVQLFDGLPMLCHLVAVRAL